MENTTLDLKKVSFNKEEKKDFVSVLKERVNLYFTESQVSQRAGPFMYLKSLFMLTVVALNYAAILFSVGGTLPLLGLYILLGLTVSISTMNIAHDALHGAYTSTSIGNRILGYLMDLSGASSFYWKKGHTIDHHTYTNIAEHDADLMVPVIIRLCPDAPYRSYHRFQQFYAPFLYMMNFLHWIYISDSKRIYRALKNKFSPHKQTGYKQPSTTEIALLIAFKLIHVSLFLILPMALLPSLWWQIAIGYCAYLFTAGITVTIVFQLAHIVEDVSFPLPNDEGKIENSFAKHQISTTSNFAMHSKLVSFLFGGLNFQVEHHLFPNICHTHLYKIAPIVQETAHEFGLTYHHKPTFWAAVRSHFRMLKKFGSGPS